MSDLNEARARIKAILIRDDLSPAMKAKAERAIEILDRLMLTQDLGAAEELVDALSRLRRAANDG